MTQKGEFGAIEFVFGMDDQHRVTGMYIQRQRERDQRFRAESFFGPFKGLGVEGAAAFADPQGSDGTVGTRAVTLGTRKALIEFDELVLRPQP